MLELVIVVIRAFTLALCGHRELALEIAGEENQAVPVSCVKLAPQAGLEPATFRLTGGKNGISGALRDVAARCCIVRQRSRNPVIFRLALFRALALLAGFCFIPRARTGQSS